MRVAVVTPYYREEWPVLQRCLDSVVAQSFSTRHFVVADGHPQPQAEMRDVFHIGLPEAHGDNGNFARGVGAREAVAQGFDVIIFLDADNWLRPDHVENILAVHERHPDAGIVTSLRVLHWPDGGILFNGDPNIFTWAQTDFVDTSCMAFFRPAFAILSVWSAMPRELGPACDRIVWKAVQARKIRVAHSLEPTVHFTTVYAGHYKALHKTPPPGAKTARDVAPALRLFDAMPEADRKRLLLGDDG